MPVFDLTSCAAVITGASSGLGQGFARQLVGRAERLLLVARRAEPMEALKRELVLKAPALSVEVMSLDLAANEAAEQLAARLVAVDFQPNVLINNAGMGDYGTVASASTDRLRAQMRLNMEGLVLATHAVLPLLRRPGAILNVGSLAGTLPMPDAAVYGATKAFVDRFSEALAVELRGEGVTVTCVAPGPTPTSFSENARRAGGGDTVRAGQELLSIPPEQVVHEGLVALERGRPMVFPGFGVGLAAALFPRLPRAILRLMLWRRFELSRKAGTS